MENKQTAVDVLYSFLYEMKSFNGFDPYNFNHKELFEQAKAIERSQKAEEYLKGFKDGKEYQIKLDELTFKSE